MIIIDIRPYGLDPNLLNLVKQHYNHIRGTSQVIYTLPDEIWATPDQSEALGESYLDIPIIIEDDQRTNI